MSRELRHGRPHREAGVGRQLFQCESQQGGRGGLAVHPGDGQAALTVHQRRQQHGPPRQRSLHLRGGLQFGVREPHGGGIDHQNGPRLQHLAGGVAEMDARATLLQFAREVAGFEIRAGDAKPGVEQQVRERAHAATADAHEVNRGAAGRAFKQAGCLIWGQEDHLILTPH